MNGLHALSKVAGFPKPCLEISYQSALMPVAWTSCFINLVLLCLVSTAIIILFWLYRLAITIIVLKIPGVPVGDKVVISPCLPELAVLAVSVSNNNYRVKNSWGTSWGQSGYFTMPAGVNCLGVNNNPSVYPH